MSGSPLMRLDLTILRPEHYDAWLDPSVKQADVLQPLLAPLDAAALTLFSVNPWVNDARHEGPRCLERVDPESSLF